MYNNIGGKIKKLAIVIFAIETIIFFIGGIVVIAVESDLFLVGILVMIIGAIFAWISSFILYGFGELIDKTTEIANNTKLKKDVSNFDNKKRQDKSNNLKILLEKGLISEKEYHQKIISKQ